jgi:hypothetical protein
MNVSRAVSFVDSCAASSLYSGLVNFMRPYKGSQYTQYATVHRLCIMTVSTSVLSNMFKGSASSATILLADCFQKRSSTATGVQSVRYC